VLGPVLVYSGGLGADRISAYDLGRRRPIWSAAALDNGFVAIRGVVVVDSGVVLSTPKSVYFLGLDGQPERKLFDLQPGWEGFSQMAVSYDGSMLAVSLVLPFRPIGTPLPSGSQAVRRMGAILFYDLVKERQISVVQGSVNVPLADGLLVWRDDGSGVVLSSYTNSERPPPLTTVFKDGRTVPHGVDGYADVAPNGRSAMRGLGSVDCLALADHQMLFEDLLSGINIAQFHNSERLFTGLGWSRDSQEYLFISRPFVAEQVCNIHSLPITYLVLDTQSGQISTVTDLKALFQRWYGNDFFWMECETGYVPFTNGKYGVTRGYCPEKPGGVRSPVTLSYGDVALETGDNFQPVGIIP
jgi:hypothetical protein